MSAESVMESLGLSFAKKNGDKFTSKYLPHNNYCIDPTQQDLKVLSTLDNSANTNRYHIYQSELEIMTSDMQRLKEETDICLAREKQVLAHKAEYISITIKKDAGLALTPEDENILLGLTRPQLEGWIKDAIT